MRHRYLFVVAVATAPSIVGAANAAPPPMPFDVSAIPDAEFLGYGREAQFSTSTHNKPMTQVRDNYILMLPGTGGIQAPVIVIPAMISSPSSPYPDETESSLGARKPLKSGGDPDAFEDRAMIDGALFRVAGFGQAGTRSKENSLQYSGNKNGRGYLIHVSYEASKISTAAVRAALEKARFSETEAQGAVAAFDAFAATAVSAQGLRTPMGVFAFREAPKFQLFIARTENTAGQDYRQANYMLRYRGPGEFEAWCGSAGGSDADRVAIEKKLLSGPVISGLSEPETIAGTNPEIHRYQYKRESIYGSGVPEEAWLKVHDGQAYLVSVTLDSLRKQSRDAIATQLAAARCQPDLLQAQPASN